MSRSFKKPKPELEYKIGDNRVIIQSGYRNGHSTRGRSIRKNNRLDRQLNLHHNYDNQIHEHRFDYLYVMLTWPIRFIEGIWSTIVYWITISKTCMKIRYAQDRYGNNLIGDGLHVKYSMHDDTQRVIIRNGVLCHYEYRETIGLILKIMGVVFKHIIIISIVYFLGKFIIVKIYHLWKYKGHLHPTRNQLLGAGYIDLTKPNQSKELELIRQYKLKVLKLSKNLERYGNLYTHERRRRVLGEIVQYENRIHILWIKYLKQTMKEEDLISKNESIAREKSKIYGNPSLKDKQRIIQV